MKRTTIALIGAAVIVAGAAITAALATRTAPGQWTYAAGTLTIDADLLDEVTVDAVEVFTAPDGRYRVIVERADGTGEEIAFDGDVKTMLITGPGGGQQAALIDSSANFAVMSPDYAEAHGYDVLESMNGRVTHWVKETEHARVEFLLGPVNEIAADETKVTISIPAGVEVPDEVINLDE